MLQISVLVCGIYLVADCDGGTVDLTVHELDEGGKLKELYKATGGAWGSMGIDCKFEALLWRNIYGPLHSPQTNQLGEVDGSL